VAEEPAEKTAGRRRHPAPRRIATAEAAARSPISTAAAETGGDATKEAKAGLVAAAAIAVATVTAMRAAARAEDSSTAMSKGAVKGAADNAATEIVASAGRAGMRETRIATETKVATGTELAQVIATMTDLDVIGTEAIEMTRKTTSAVAATVTGIVVEVATVEAEIVEVATAGAAVTETTIEAAATETKAESETRMASGAKIAVVKTERQGAVGEVGAGVEAAAERANDRGRIRGRAAAVATAAAAAARPAMRMISPRPPNRMTLWWCSTTRLLSYLMHRLQSRVSPHPSHRQPMIERLTPS